MQCLSTQSGIKQESRSPPGLQAEGTADSLLALHIMKKLGKQWQILGCPQENTPESYCHPHAHTQKHKCTHTRAHVWYACTHIHTCAHSCLSWGTWLMPKPPIVPAWEQWRLEFLPKNSRQGKEDGKGILVFLPPFCLSHFPVLLVGQTRDPLLHKGREPKAQGKFRD